MDFASHGRGGGAGESLVKPTCIRLGKSATAETDAVLRSFRVYSLEAAARYNRIGQTTALKSL